MPPASKILAWRSSKPKPSWRGEGADGADAALAVLDAAAARTPLDVRVQSERVELVTTYKKWRAAERSVEGLKQALYESGGSATARARRQTRASTAEWARLGQRAGRVPDRAGRSARTTWRSGSSTGRRPSPPDTWRDGAVRRYAQAARLSPNSPDIVAAQRALEQRRADLRALTIGGAGAPASP